MRTCLPLHHFPVNVGPSGSPLPSYLWGHRRIWHSASLNEDDTTMTLLDKIGRLCMHMP